MTPEPDRLDDERIIAAQVGRTPRGPWRVASNCAFGYPSSIVSPSRLADGTPFPAWAWLTCPWLSERVSAEESDGAAALWACKAVSDPELAERLRDVDTAVRAAREVEGSDGDACSAVGIAGQRDPLAVKCLHAHVALALAGLDDPIGADILERHGTVCPDRRCDSIVRSNDVEGR